MFNKTNSLLEELNKTIEVLGVDDTICELKRLRQSGTELTMLINFIINSSCSEFGISRSQLIGSYTKGEKHDCRTVCYYLIKAKTSLSNKDIAKRFGKNSHFTVGASIKLINSLNTKIPDHKKLKQKLENITEIVNKFIKESELEILQS